MTSEEDFQKALDKNPKDWQTRLVFADWLEERGDERAAGYRCLGVRRRRPAYDGSFEAWSFWVKTDNKEWSEIPLVWWRKVAGLFKAMRATDSTLPRHPYLMPTRRGCEDMVARAFARLTKSQQQDFLTARPRRAWGLRKARKK